MALPSAAFNATDSLYAGLCVVSFTPTVPAQITGVTSATDTLTKTAHGYAVGQLLTYVSGTGFTGLTPGSSYYVVAVPTPDTFKVSATVAGAAIAVGTSTVGIFQLSPLVFETRLVSLKSAQEDKALEKPDSTGVLRVVRRVVTKESEEFTYELIEPKRLLTIFGGKLSGSVTGNTVIYAPDPQDASGKCALVSESFASRITRDGDLEFGNGDFTKCNIKIDSFKNGAILWTRDSTV